MAITQHWRAVLLTAIAYFVLGRLGLALAIPPGYASPVFPAAGLALAMVLYFGRGVLPGIWLGSLAINLFLAWKQGGGSRVGVVVAVGLACGASLQAWVAHGLVQRQLGEAWKRLETEREILGFLFLGGPLACLVAASTGAAVLYFSGFVTRDELSYSWWSWWVGDTLGVLVFAPLTLIVLLRAQRSWAGRLHSIALPMLVSIALVSGAFAGAAHWERKLLSERIADHGERLVQLLQARFVAHQEVLSSLRRLVEVMPEMDFRRFEYFTRISLKDNPDMFALSYNHYVRREGRMAYEASIARKSPFKDFGITERDPERRLIRAKDRPEYVPVSFIAPLEGNRPAVGYDIHSEPIRREAIETARRTGRPAVTGPILLVQEKLSRVGLLLLHPAYRQGEAGGQQPSAPELAGFSVGVLKVDEMVRIATSKSLPSGLVLQLEDAGAPVGRNLLFRSHSGPPEPGAHLWKTRLAMADRNWLMQLSPTAEYLSRHRSWSAWLVGVVGLCLAALLQILLLAMTGRTVLVQRQVDQQTGEINSKNAALQAALERQELLGAAISQSNSSIIITDEKGDIVFVNDAFVSTSGYAREEVLGRNPRILKSGLTPSQVYQDLWRTLLSKNNWRGELQNRKKSGATYWELATISPVVDARGRITHFIAIKENITDRKCQEAELQEAKEKAEAASVAKGRFLATMSHEIRTPMNGIIGLSQLALEKDLSAEARGYLEKIHLSSQNLLGILNDILDYSKIESGRMMLERADFGLDELLVRLQNIFALHAEEKGLRFIIDVAPDVPRALIGDVLRLQQILSNLVGNAVKFTDAGWVAVRISLLDQDERQARIRWVVEDTGIGMDAGVVDSLFQPFQQGDNTISRRFGGTGLGLVICRQLLHMMGADLRLESQPGRGSVFSFDLCLEVAKEQIRPVRGRRRKGVEATANLSTRLTEEAEGLSGKRILLAEDHLVNQQVVSEFLRMAGLQVDLAENGLQVLERLETARYDAVLMDINMPRMDGLEATRRIRCQDEYRHLPIIALTAGVTVEEREGALASGMNDLVAKPVAPETLLRALRRWILPDTAASLPPADLDEAAGLPAVPGFDLSHLHAMLGGDEAQVQRLLKLFGQDAAMLMPQLEEAFADGDLPHAKALAHNLKGASGNAGAVALHQAAVVLDGELKNGAFNPVSMATLRQCLTETLQAIARLEKAPYELQRKEDAQALAESILRIERALAAQEWVPEEWLRDMESCLPPDQDGRFAQLRRAVENIDYRQAREMIEIFKQGK